MNEQIVKLDWRDHEDRSVLLTIAPEFDEVSIHKIQTFGAPDHWRIFRVHKSVVRSDEFGFKQYTTRESAKLAAAQSLKFISVEVPNLEAMSEQEMNDREIWMILDSDTRVREWVFSFPKHDEIESIRMRHRCVETDDLYMVNISDNPRVFALRSKMLFRYAIVELDPGMMDTISWKELAVKRRLQWLEMIREEAAERESCEQLSNLRSLLSELCAYVRRVNGYMTAEDRALLIVAEQAAKP